MMIDKFYKFREPKKTEYHIILEFYCISPIMKRVTKKLPIIMNIDNNIRTTPGIEYEIRIKNYYKLIKYIFKDCEVINNQHVFEAGLLDFGIKNNEGEELQLEFKKDKDSLKKSQLDWIYRNKDKNIAILYVEDEIYSTKEEEERTEEFLKNYKEGEEEILI